MQVRNWSQGMMVLLAVGAALMAGFPARAAAAAYTVRQITNETLALGYLGLNHGGQMVWQRNTSVFGANICTVFLYSGGAVRMLSDPGVHALFPQLNNLGQVTWEKFNNLDSTAICLFSDDEVNTLASGDDHFTAPHGPKINNRGQVLWSTGSPEHGGDPRTIIWLYTHETKTTVPITGGTEYDVSAVLNDNGAIAWDRVIGIVGPEHAICLYGAGPFQEISGRGSFTFPILINNQNQVVYHGFGANDGNLYFYDGKPNTIYSNSDHPPSQAAMNHLGQVVYMGYDEDNKPQIFLYHQGSTINISQSLDPWAGSPVNHSPGINDRGQVVWVHGDGMSSPQVFLYDSGKITQVTSGYWSFTGIGPLINDQGQITWIGVNQPFGMTGQVFLATPVGNAPIYNLLLD